MLSSEFVIEEKSRGETVLKHLNGLRYTREYVRKVTKANRSGDGDLVSACLRLLTELNLFLRKSLQYLSRSLAVNLARGLTSSSVDQRGEALSEASEDLNQLLRDKVNLIILQRDEALERRELANWISNLDFDQTQDRYRRGVCEGTGAWFLEKDEIKRYINGESRWILCEGKGTSITSFSEITADM